MSCKETQERIRDEILFYIQTFHQMPYKSLSFKGILELFLIRDNDVRMQQVFRNIWNELAISNVFLCAWLCVWMSERVCAFPFAIVLTAGANYAMSFGQCAHSPPTLYSDRWNPMENLENSIGCDTTLIQRQYLHTSTHTHMSHTHLLSFTGCNINP